MEEITSEQTNPVAKRRQSQIQELNPNQRIGGTLSPEGRKRKSGRNTKPTKVRRSFSKRFSTSSERE
jgi:hypothetical protein